MTSPQPVLNIRNPTAAALISRHQDNLSGSPSSVKGGVVCLDTPDITSPIEDELYPDAYGLRRPRSQSLDSGAPLVPPPLSSALLREELSSGFWNCNCTFQNKIITEAEYLQPLLLHFPCNASIDSP